MSKRITGSKLTGKARFRSHTQSFGPDRVVLQVEVSWPDGPCDENGIERYLRGTGWVDAVPDDLQYLVVAPVLSTECGSTLK